MSATSIDATITIARDIFKDLLEITDDPSQAYAVLQIVNQLLIIHANELAKTTGKTL